MSTFFIVGVQRSGTTLLSVMLEKHPAVLMEEQAAAFRIITAFKNLYELLPFNLQYDKKEIIKWLIKNDVNGRLETLIDYKNLDNYDSIRELIEGSIQKKLITENKIIWGDKAPNLQHFLNDLMLLIPNAKIIHIVRDGRANAYSTATRSYRNLKLSAQQWVEGNIFGIVNQEILGDKNYKLIRYEDLLTNPEREAKNICTFLDIAYHPNMVNLSDDKLQQEKSYVKGFFDQSKIDKWKTQLKKSEIKQIENIQGPLLQKIGYELDTPISALNFKTLSLRRKIWYSQMDNIKQLFSSTRKGMKNKELITYKIPLKNRIYSFARFFVRDIFSLPIFKSLFSRFYYKEKYYKK